MNYVVVANVSLPDSCLRMGARVIVLAINGNPDRVRVRGLSRGGRRVTKYTRRKGLANVRPAWEHSPPDDGRTFATKEDAAAWIEARFGNAG